MSEVRPMTEVEVKLFKEVERLKERLVRVEEARQIDLDMLSKQGILLREENERLRAGDADMAKTGLAKTAKIERLREENETLRAALTDAERAINLALHAVGTLREEIERLRGLLRECVPHINGNIGSWAAEAPRMSEQGQVVAKQKVAEGEELLERIHHTVYVALSAGET